MSYDPHSLEQTAAALEAFTDDLRHTVREGRGQHSMEAQIAVQRWNALAADLGLEVLAPLRGFWETFKTAVNHSTVVFGRWMEAVRAYLDRSGGRALDLLRKRLDTVAGDSDGSMIIDQALANRLAVRGRVSSDFQTPTTELIQLVDQLEHVLPKLLDFNHSVLTALGSEHASDFPTAAAVWSGRLKKAVEQLVQHPTPMELLPEGWKTASFIGGYRLLMAAEYPQEQPRSALARRVWERWKKAPEYTLTRGDALATATNPRLPVLSRSECRALIDQAERLTDALYRLMRLADTVKTRFTTDQVVGYVEELRHALHKAAVLLTAEDREHLELLTTYFARTVDERALIKRIAHLVQQAHKAYQTYIEASLKRFQ